MINDVVEDIELTKEFSRALAKLEAHEEGVLYLTGQAGSGKSTLVKFFVEKTEKNSVLLAPTGVAAVNIGGQTIHSFFKFGLQPPVLQNANPSHKAYDKVDCIIIDEVSMVRADMLDLIDRHLRASMDSDEPFGGIPIILCGDMNQLPPVMKSNQVKYYLRKTGYSSPYFFEAKCLKKARSKCVKLRRSYRQQDEAFLAMLDKIKNGEITDSVLSELNERVIDLRDMNQEETDIMICTTNNKVDKINERKLKSINKNMSVFKAIISGNFNPNHSPVDETIAVKPGCRIMMMANDPDKKWVNGTMATYVGKTEKGGKDVLEVKIDGMTHKVPRYIFESVRYVEKEDPDKKKTKLVPETTGAFKQFPIRLGYAVTVHKSQGKTFDSATIDFGSGTFAHGMAYVALSRCRTLEGIHLVKKVRREDIKIDKRILAFNEKVEEKAINLNT